MVANTHPCQLFASLWVVSHLFWYVDSCGFASICFHSTYFTIANATATVRLSWQMSFMEIVMNATFSVLYTAS